MNPTPDSRNDSLVRHVVAIALLLVAVWFATLGARKLLNPDEGRYAEIPREMIASGDWLTPRLNDLKYFEKPPLQYWTTAIAFKVFGMNEFAARFWVGFTGLAGVFFAGWIGGRLYGRDAGVISAAVLASGLMYTVLGHIDTLDMGLSFFLELAVGGFLLAQTAPPNSTTERNGMLLAWAAAALAVLSKGIVALALPTLALVLYSAIERDFSPWRRLHPVKGSILFLALAAPWFVWVSIVNPEFAKFFFLHEHFQRFLTDVANRVEPWWYFLPLLLVGALPWTGFAVAAFYRAWRADAEVASNFKTRRFLILWVAGSLLFFSVSQSKLPPYIVPLFPAIALLIGDYLVRARTVIVARHLGIVALVCFAALGYVVFGPLPTRRDTPTELFEEVFNRAIGGFALATIGIGVGWLLARRRRVTDALIVACAGSLLLWSSLLTDFKAMRHLRSGFDLAESIAPFHDTTKPFYSIWDYDHSLSFYLARAVTLVDYQGELMFGQQQEPGKALTLSGFVAAWNRDPPGTLAVMKPDAYRFLTEQGVPMTVIGGNLHLMAVKRP